MPGATSTASGPATWSQEKVTSCAADVAIAWRDRRHLCAHTIGLGVNRSGPFAEYVSLSMTNIWRHWDGVAEEIAAIFDPFGNAVHSGLDISPVVTHRFSYREYEQAFAIARSGQSGKVILDWSGT
jgi:threonine dehydrogenase-like Zn-dependent dehydrogenase